MEVVAMVGKELQLDLHHVANNTIKEKIDMIIDVADNVTSTNAFLIMTINRCVDYTKSTFGITLQPKLEPFRIRDIVNFVVNCCIHSNEMTERFHIGIEEDSSDRRRTESTGHQENISQLSHPATLSPNSISSLIAVNYAHPGLLDGSVTIYSDRQWIQENLLCMLTNALRYSEHREAVSINVSVVSSAVSAASSVSSTSSAFGSSVDDLKSTSANKSCNSEVTELIIRVYDDGEMLDEDQRERIFQEPIQSSRITGGVGVGLYTIALRVSALGGRYGIEEVTQNAEKHADASSEASNSQILGRKYFWFSIPFNFCGQSNPGSAVQRQVTEDLATMRSLTSTVTNSVIAPALTQESKLQEPIITQEAHHAINTTTLENTEIEPEDKETKKVPLHILVVDDSPLVVKMTSLALKKQGFQVSVADNGKTAIDKFKRSLEKKNKQPSDLQHDPSVHYEKDVIDIILMDFQMPVMDGIEAIRQVRLIESEFYGISSASKHVTENPVFIIGFSAKSDDDQVQVAYECGMNAFLSKPFTLTAFQSILSQI
jgi:CheY-like chemotaxis protein